MIKTLKHVGNSHSLVIDKPIMEQMGVKTGSRLQLTLSGRSLVITPVDDVVDDAVFDKAVNDCMKKYGNALLELAK